MGILRSFNVGISGLNAIGHAMGVTADNIANASTTGFKTSRAEFQDVLASSLGGVDSGDQLGTGTRLAHVKRIVSQGDVSRTDNITDLAISGDGYFKVEAGFGSGYSRDGSFHFNKTGELINSDGYKVVGFQANENGDITSKEGAIKIGNTTIGAKATADVTVNMNFDSRGEVKEFDVTNPDKTSNFSHSLTIFDNVGTARLMTMYYNKTADNNWTYRALVDGADAAGGVEGIPVEMASGQLIFNDKGVLQAEQPGTNAFNFNKGAAPGQQIQFDWGVTLAEGGDGTDGSTQFGSESAVARHTQDGFSAATLTSMSFNDDAVLSAIYSNGTSKNIAQIAIAKFENDEALFKVGKNLLKENRKSGQAAMGKPGESGRGDVLSKSLELSNVDIANEFVGLMTAQRNFQANAKTLTTADQMLNEVLNIKR